MQLADYLKKNSLRQADLARAIGVSEATISRYLRTRVPEPRSMQRIIEFTGGAVQPNDFFPPLERAS